MQHRVSLFVPCFVDQLLPEVAVDTVKVLRRVGCEVEFPEDQTCCGQPAFNTGYWEDARPCAEKFLRVFKDADVVVCPSGSCTAMVRTFYPELLSSSPLRSEAIALGLRTFELSEFLVKVADLMDVGATFPHTVTYHASCHGLRELRLRDEPLQLLRNVKGLKLMEMARYDAAHLRGRARFKDWEAARQKCQEIKREAINHLDRYLLQFEEKVISRGGHVFWAANAEEARNYVLGVASRCGVRTVVKSKSMVTEEIYLAPALEKAGIAVWETDLGEFIVQLRNEPPYHIVTPAMHLNRGQIAELFREKIGAEIDGDDPSKLVTAARLRLRRGFFGGGVGLSGAHFLVAGSGGVARSTHEGN